MKEHHLYTVKTLLVLGALICSPNVFAEDWAVPTNGNCKVSYGTTAPALLGLRATSTSVAVSCNLVKEVGSNSLQNVWVRVKHSGGSAPFCMLYSQAPTSTTSKSTIKYASYVGVQSIYMPLPSTQYYSGYSNVTCWLYKDDIIYGVRYKQIN